jgi:hypothetical protein
MKITAAISGVDNYAKRLFRCVSLHVPWLPNYFVLEFALIQYSNMGRSRFEATGGHQFI